MPAPAIMALTKKSVVAITTPLWDRWEATAIVVDSRGDVTPEQRNLARTIVRELRAPALNAFELSRLRGRVAAAQRTRLARDLHDGLLQSLIGLELKTHALRERIVQRDPDTAAGLGQIQRALRKETAEARRLTQQLRAAVVEPHELAENMGAAVMKFQHDTSIAATFDADEEYGALSSRVAAELMRILQESLANVRRHSRAQSVGVKLAHADGNWRLVVEDDGAGFGFSGRRTLDELTRTHTGPATIMERVRLLNGQLFVDSFPTRGARLEVVVPAGGRS
jgi:signal transduction histidine kinase